MDEGTSSGAVEAVARANERWWQAERALIDGYWSWSGRTVETDLAWLARQCHKELRDGVAVRAAALHDALAHPSPSGWGELDRAVEGITTEHAHLRAFADVYDAFAPPGAPRLSPATAAAHGWAENEALMALRAEHRAHHGHLGVRAFAITEGGGGALYASGAALTGRGGIDDAIAAACAAVADDEQHHREEWVAELELRPDDLELLVALSVDQSRARLRMRWAQFGRPVPEADLEADIQALER